jgi:hypothetical protein
MKLGVPLSVHDQGSPFLVSDAAERGLTRGRYFDRELYETYKH